MKPRQHRHLHAHSPTLRHQDLSTWAGSKNSLSTEGTWQNSSTHYGLQRQKTQCNQQTVLGASLNQPSKQRKKCDIMKHKVINTGLESSSKNTKVNDKLLKCNIENNKNCMCFFHCRGVNSCILSFLWDVPVNFFLFPNA